MQETRPETRKGSGTRPEPSRNRVNEAYLRAVETLEKVFFRLVPRPWTTAMIATEIPAAMRPYSMAVAPDSSFTKRAKRVFMSWLLKVHTWLSERDPAAVFSGRLDHRRRYQREISMGLNRSMKPAVYRLFRIVVNNALRSGELRYRCAASIYAPASTRQGAIGS